MKEIKKKIYPLNINVPNFVKLITVLQSSSELVVRHSFSEIDSDDREPAYRSAAKVGLEIRGVSWNNVPTGISSALPGQEHHPVLAKPGPNELLEISSVLIHPFTGDPQYLIQTVLDEFSITFGEIFVSNPRGLKAFGADKTEEERKEVEHVRFNL